MIARRRAGLSQAQLAERLGKPQPTVARWESGKTEPTYATVREVVGACGLDMQVGLAAADASWVSTIYALRQLEPAARVRRLSFDDRDRVAALQLVGAASPHGIVVGEVAGALHGWPLILDPQGTIDVVAPAAEVDALRDVLGTETSVRLVSAPAGTYGYRDLSRGAEDMVVDGLPVRVAGLVDLLRIALADTAPHARQWALALEATLQEARRPLASPPDPDPQGGQAAEAWLASQ